VETFLKNEIQHGSEAIEELDGRSVRPVSTQFVELQVVIPIEESSD